MAIWRLFSVTVMTLVLLRHCTAETHKVSRVEMFPNLESMAEKQLKNMTLDNCTAKGNERNTTTCRHLHSTELTRVRNSCFCIRHWSDIGLYLDCEHSTSKRKLCCENNLRCLNGGTVNQTFCMGDRYDICSCKPPFHGDWCQFVNVSRTCSLSIPADDDRKWKPCHEVGESNTTCLLNKGRKQYKCRLDSDHWISSLIKDKEPGDPHHTPSSSCLSGTVKMTTLVTMVMLLKIVL